MSKADRRKKAIEPYDKRENFEHILSSLHTGLALINPDLTVAWVNEVTLGILPWDELIGKICYEAAAQRDEPCEGCGAILAFKDGHIHETERKSPVDHRWHYIVSVPIKDEIGKVTSVLESVTDITERKSVEIERDKALKELKALQRKLEEENIYLKSELRDARLFAGMIGTSNALRYVQTRIAQVAPTNATVLIQGETGVGKELVARAIHEDSKSSSSKPFIKVNCAAIPANLVESELFGHEKGAFTGAVQQRKGRFELADKGILFLDEISELPQDTQAKLLRVLQDGEFERVGGTRTLKSDLRIIAATNKDLHAEVAASRFRADLFYRLNVYPITVPPLRKRREDIPLLVEHFISLIAPGIGRHIDSIPRQVMDQLKSYDWPGNVRELRNVIERSIIISPNSKLRVPDDLITGQKLSSVEPGSRISLDEVQRLHILAILEKTGGKLEGPDGAAAILQLKPSTLRHRMKKLGIKR
ncbi:MAG: sigma 54-interacting transcriptional regulator [Desulfobulbales bacterium]